MARSSRGLAVVAAAAVAVTAACTHRPVHTWPDELAGHADELTTTGRARVDVVEEGDQVVRADTRVTVAIPDGPGRRIREVTIAELVAGCGEAGPGEDAASDRGDGGGGGDGDGACLARRVVQVELEVGTRRKTHVAGTVSSVLSGVGVAGLVGLCVAECTTKRVAIGGGVILGLAVLTVLSFAWD